MASTAYHLHIIIMHVKSLDTSTESINRLGSVVTKFFATA